MKHWKSDLTTLLLVALAAWGGYVAYRASALPAVPVHAESWRADREAVMLPRP